MSNLHEWMQQNRPKRWDAKELEGYKLPTRYVRHENQIVDLASDWRHAGMVGAVCQPGDYNEGGVCQPRLESDEMGPWTFWTIPVFSMDDRELRHALLGSLLPASFLNLLALILDYESSRLWTRVLRYYHYTAKEGNHFVRGLQWIADQTIGEIIPIGDLQSFRVRWVWRPAAFTSVTVLTDTDMQNEILYEDELRRWKPETFSHQLDGDLSCFWSPTMLSLSGVVENLFRPVLNEKEQRVHPKWSTIALLPRPGTRVDEYTSTWLVPYPPSSSWSPPTSLSEWTYIQSIYMTDALPVPPDVSVSAVHKTSHWTLRLEKEWTICHTLDHDLKPLQAKIQTLALVDRLGTVVCNLSRLSNRPQEIRLPSQWELKLVIGEQEQMIPSLVALALLERFKHAFMHTNMEDPRAEDCETFARRMVVAQSLPLLTVDAQSQGMQPWYPLQLRSAPGAGLTKMQQVVNIAREPEFLHSALYTGIKGYYLCKMGTDPVFLLATLAQLLQLYPAAKQLHFTRRFNRYCCHPECQYSDPAWFDRTHRPPLTLCSCRQAQFCSSVCQSAFASSHHAMHKIISALMQDKYPPPYQVLTADQIRDMGRRFEHQPVAATFDASRMHYFSALTASISPSVSPTLSAPHVNK